MFSYQNNESQNKNLNDFNLILLFIIILCEEGIFRLMKSDSYHLYKPRLIKLVLWQKTKKNPILT